MEKKHKFCPEDIQELPDSSPKLTPKEKIYADAKKRLSSTNNPPVHNSNSLTDMEYIGAYQQSCKSLFTNTPNSPADFVIWLLNAHNIRAARIDEIVFYVMPSRTNPSNDLYIFQKSDLTIIRDNCLPNSIFSITNIDKRTLKKVIAYHHKIALQDKSIIPLYNKSTHIKPYKIIQSICMQLIEHNQPSIAKNSHYYQNQYKLLTYEELKAYNTFNSISYSAHEKTTPDKLTVSILWTISQGNIYVIDQLLKSLAIALLGYKVARIIHPKIKKHAIIICRDVPLIKKFIINLLQLNSLFKKEDIISTYSISDFSDPNKSLLPINNDLLDITVNIDTEQNHTETNVKKFKELTKNAPCHLNENLQDDVFGKIFYNCHSYFISIASDLEAYREKFPSADLIHFTGDISGKTFPNIDKNNAVVLALIALKYFIESPSLDELFPQIESDDNTKSNLEHFESFINRFFINTQNKILQEDIDKLLQNQDISKLNTSGGHTNRRKISAQLGITSLDYTARDDVIFAFSQWSNMDIKKCSDIVEKYFARWKISSQYLFYIKLTKPISPYGKSLKESLVIYGLKLKKDELEQAIEDANNTSNTGATEKRFADYINFLYEQLEDWKFVLTSTKPDSWKGITRWNNKNKH